MKHLIVDGYNVLNAIPRYLSLLETDADSARARLVEEVADFAAGSYQAVVVFDAGGNASSTGRPHRAAGVSVIFSPAGQDADAVIEGLAVRFRDRGEQAVVVTSDAETQRLSAAVGATRMSAREFERAIDEAVHERGEFRASGSSRSRIEDRLGAGLREKLFRWARGE